jgi:hypothetical protein
MVETHLGISWPKHLSLLFWAGVNVNFVYRASCWTEVCRRCSSATSEYFDGSVMNASLTCMCGHAQMTLQQEVLGVTSKFEHPNWGGRSGIKDMCLSGCKIGCDLPAPPPCAVSLAVACADVYQDSANRQRNNSVCQKHKQRCKTAAQTQTDSTDNPSYHFVTDVVRSLGPITGCLWRQPFRTTGSRTVGETRLARTYQSVREQHYWGAMVVQCRILSALAL